eukprot:COSAG06_NODE_25708_length_630_cov_1.523540_1_plen_47_part_10
MISVPDVSHVAPQSQSQQLSQSPTTHGLIKHNTRRRETRRQSKQDGN